MHTRRAPCVRHAVQLIVLRPVFAVMHHTEKIGVCSVARSLDVRVVFQSVHFVYTPASEVCILELDAQSVHRRGVRAVVPKPLDM